MTRSTLTRTSPFLHRKVITKPDADTVLLTCSHDRCDLNVLFPVTPNTGANLFLTFNLHLDDV